MIYIAGPFFTPIERMYLAEMICWVRENYPNEELFIPMEHFIPDGALMPNDEWAEEVFKMDTTAIKLCDKVIALYLGHYSDTGTAWELGYAHALDKEVQLYIPKSLQTTDMSLMAINGAVPINYKISLLNQK